MRNSIIVSRYAEAYVSFALPRIGLPRIVDDVRLLLSVMREAPELAEFFRAPEVPLPEKTVFLDNVLGKVLAQETIDYIKYLISKRRVEHLANIADHIRREYSHGEVADVVLQTTFPLELDMVGRIKDLLSRRLQKKVNLYLELNPELLGGVRIAIENKVIDGSVRNRLQGIKKQLLKAQVGNE